jgi:hypothetical protein
MGQGDQGCQHQGAVKSSVIAAGHGGICRRCPADQPLPKKVRTQDKDGRRPVEGRLLVRTMGCSLGSGFNLSKLGVHLARVHHHLQIIYHLGIVHVTPRVIVVCAFPRGYPGRANISQWPY